MEIKQSSLTIPQSRGKRVKSARMLGGLTREYLAQKHQIAAPTLRAWETPRENGGGLTINGAERFIEALKKEGIFCTAEWLLNGIGPGPRLESDPQNFKSRSVSIDQVDWNEEEAILKEIQTFKDCNPNAVTLLVMDDGMEPMFKEGAYVGGIRKSGPLIEKHIGKPCIIHTKDNLVLLRLFQKGKLQNTYTLYCLNPNPTLTKPILYEKNIETVAEVIWARTKVSVL